MQLQRWIVRQPQTSAPLRLFCFPYAGGGTRSYAPWQAILGEVAEVCMVQLPGRGARLLESCESSFEQLVDTLTRLVALESDRPLVLFGHSLGAVMAFEVTRTLRARGLQLPLRLIVSACEAPHVRSSSRRYHEFNDSDLISALRDLNGTSTLVLENAEMMRLVLPAIRADFALNADYAYRHEAPLNLPITVFAGEYDNHVKIDGARRWCEQSTQTIELHNLPGGHFFIDTHRSALMSHLRPMLISIAKSPLDTFP
jgi:medium-chain acyl-[acyl-carrier-protein] hydrolase